MHSIETDINDPRELYKKAMAEALENIGEKEKFPNITMLRQAAEKAYLAFLLAIDRIILHRVGKKIELGSSGAHEDRRKTLIDPKNRLSPDWDEIEKKYFELQSLLHGTYFYAGIINDVTVFLCHIEEVGNFIEKYWSDIYA